MVMDNLSETSGGDSVPQEEAAVARAIERRQEVRLLEADQLVREGRARVDEGWLVVKVASDPAVEVTARWTLPPAPVACAVLATGDQRFAGSRLVQIVERTAVHLAPLLPGEVRIDPADQVVALRWNPPPDTLDEATRRALWAATHVSKGLSEAAYNSDIEALERLRDRFMACQGRAQALEGQFPDHAISSSVGVGILHTLRRSQQGGQERLVVVQRGVDLNAPVPGHGMFIALRFPALEDETRELLAGELNALSTGRYGVGWRASEDYSVIEEWPDLTGVLLLEAEPRDQPYHELLSGVSSCARLLSSFVEFAWGGHDPFELLGTTRADATRRAAGDDDVTTDDGLQQGWADALHTQQVARAPKPAAKPEPAAKAIDRLSAREVVKRLRAAENATRFDVFLVSAGYNIEKTCKIMSIVLSLSAEEAREKCEAAPCRLLQAAVPSRASQVKTVLEGTGAKIRLVTEGEEPE